MKGLEGVGVFTCQSGAAKGLRMAILDSAKALYRLLKDHDLRRGWALRQAHRSPTRTISGAVRISGDKTLLLNGPGLIEIGASAFATDISDTLIWSGSKARVTIGSGCFISDGVRLLSESAVSIADGAIIGFGTTIMDTNGHATTPGGPVKCLPVTIGERAWIGAHVIVLPGVSIGADAVVGAGSVVTKSVPNGATVAGNPAQQIRTTASLL